MTQIVREKAESAPLTPLQQGMLQHSLKHPGGTGYFVEQVLALVNRPLDPLRMRVAWHNVLLRHTALRTSFHDLLTSTPLQQVQEETSLPFALVDLPGNAHDGCGESLREYVAQDRARGISVTESLPHRLTLIQLPGNRAALLWTLHHSISDARGMAAVFSDLVRLYDEPDASIAPLGSPFDLYDALSEPPDAATAEFWRDHLRGFSQPTILPLPQPPQAPSAFDTLREPIAPALLETLEVLAASAQASLCSLARATVALLLARYTRESDIGFYVTQSLRHRESQAHPRAGLYVNTLFLRLQVDTRLSMIEWSRAVQGTCAALREHELTPLARVPGWTSLPPGSPMSDILFNHEDGSFDEIVKSFPGNWEGWQFELYERPPEPLGVTLVAGATPELILEFDAGRFSRAAMQRLAGHFLQLLHEVSLKASRPMRELHLLTAAEQQLLLFDWQPPLRAPLDTTLVEMVRQAAKHYPGGKAVEQEGKSLSFAELEDRAAAVAGALAQLGVKPGQPVAIMMPRRLEMAVGVLGILQAGAAYLPIDTALPEDRVRFILEDAAVQVVATVSELADLPAFNQRTALLLDQPLPAPQACPAPPNPDSPAYILYTSGSTGTPKGVVVSHRAACTYIRSAIEIYGIKPGDRLLQFASLSFDASVEEFFAALSVGGTLVLRTDEMLGSAQIFLEQCRAWRINVLDLTTAYWHLLADAIAETPLPESVRLVMLGGEAMRQDKWQEWRRHAPPNVPVYNVYGPTEAAIGATSCEMWSCGGKEVPIGRPLPWVQAYVLDPDLMPLPVGVPGELCLGGPQLAEGYLNRPALTEAAFPPHPFAPGQRLYRTGDRVRWGEDGQIYYVGRVDRQVKVRGYRIELGEIETVLLRHPAVKEAGVITGEDALGNQMLHAYLALGEGGGELEAIQNWLRDQLPAFMQPATWTLLDALPVTVTGKLDRPALPPPHQAGALDRPASTLPLDDVEQRLAKIWTQVLRVREVGREDHFFNLGGHSLLAFVMLTQVEKQFGKRLAPVQVFQAPTLGEFASVIRGDSASANARVLQRIQPGNARPPLYFVGSTNMLPAILPGLGLDQPVYSLNLFGLLPEEGPLPEVTVPLVARRFVQELREFQPHGPYCLGGYCRDAMVALEMALQLKDAGEEVAFLAMVDVFWGAPQQHSWLRRHLRNLVEFGPSYITEKLRRRKRWLYERRQRIKSFRAARFLEPEEHGRLPQELRSTLFINRFYDHCDRYTFTPYDGRITVILASEWGVKNAPELARLATQGLEFREVRAFHQNLWQGTQALALGKAIRDCMDQKPPPAGRK